MSNPTQFLLLAFFIFSSPNIKDSTSQKLFHFDPVAGNRDNLTCLFPAASVLSADFKLMNIQIVKLKANKAKIVYH